MMTDARLQPLRERVEALEAENAELQEVIRIGQQTVAVLQERLALKDLQIQKLQSDLQRLQVNMQGQAMTSLMYQQYIPLSKPAAQQYVLNLTDTHDLAFIGHFITHTLPKDAPRQLTEEVAQLTSLPSPGKNGPSVIHVAGNYNDVHDNGQVGMDSAKN